MWTANSVRNIPYLFIALFATKVGQAIRLAPGTDFSGKVLHMMEGIRDAFASPMPSFHPADLGIGICIAAAMRLAVYIKGKNAKKFRHNQEYGSARWGTAADIAPYVDPTFENNIILTQTESLTMNNRPADPRTARNKNVLIIGGSGSGKTRFWLKPNLMQCTSKKYPVSFVVTDPKGSIVTECGKMLLHYGYRLKILNTINFKKSICAMLTELVQSYRPVAGADILFPSDEKVIGKCPRCGSKIVERSKGYFCTNRNCKFVLWRDSRFFTLKQKTLDRKTAAKLLEKGKAPLKGCVSPRTGQVYDATVLLEDDGTRPSFKLVFGNG